MSHTPVNRADPQTPHQDLHSEQGALRGEHPGRSRNPVIKVADLAWLEFEKPDLDRAEVFARDFGFAVAARTEGELWLRGTFAGSPCMVIRRGRASRFIGPAFRAAERADLDRLARATGSTVRDIGVPGGGQSVALLDPSGLPVRVVHCAEQLPALPEQEPLILNFGTDHRRTNATQRPPREPSRIQRLGHVVLETRVFARTLDWYLDSLGMIVSDFLFLDGQRGRGPTMTFIRCDQGSVAVDHHTLALHLGPGTGYVHSAYQVTDLDAIAVGGEYLAERGYKRSWGIGRHIQGSQLFDYWRDPDHFMLEHFADGDLFSCDLEPGWAPMSASGLAQWGPPVTRDFLGANPSPAKLREVMTALRGDNELDPARLLGLMKAMSS
ncbi:2,3-dihydroxybiphenyl 1,2-dioxygenase [Streptomyces sp. RLB3-17]|uniref:VOC family protein n=1 Tax=unclassified Streptomyces TaxID=2593676 RepID=UPI0011637250|nr:MULTISPECIES: VOC family protein [unclassified Streptomyces]QDN54617.1 2,3-dihydroxybiphenyl 1,2-dioxygenase [Streptomyces sp. S1D4-20]QDN64798.1 2,3-dihydroxybiphenyl 1,2-dioxygenase [Streptomyces sp. S1D4-14]QDO37207.1 2,3-dihydroxybiphenyl 1,2-dioxygenase [Streptomyces sp. RLB3-17]QDO47207.1 2,3-dihydroxybiphenyl 1,2-dioxygenase [Streptomyces sp. RLB3-5]QDO57446.1 2,3-dihydroxybiphenyl 1,2-dioxygenase [Streptomyces sp. RLB1-8]